MSHLTLEAIARLVDEEATAAEAEHIAGCASCRTELEDMRADHAVLAGLPPIAPPAGEWAMIESRLAAEGLIRLRRMGPAWQPTLLRMAASLLIFVLGTLVGGALMRGESAAPRYADQPAGGASPADAAALTGTPQVPLLEAQPSRLEAFDPAGLPDLAPRRQPAPIGGAQLASSLISAREPRSPEEAARLMREIEAMYFQFLTRLAEAEPDDAANDPFTRLAVLEGITTLTGTALGQAPADPLLNGYHLSALAQREATIKQIAARSADVWF